MIASGGIRDAQDLLRLARYAGKAWPEPWSEAPFTREHWIWVSLEASIAGKEGGRPMITKRIIPCLDVKDGRW